MVAKQLRRWDPEALDAELWRLFVLRGHSLKEVSRRVGQSPVAVAEHLERLGVETPPPSPRQAEPRPEEHAELVRLYGEGLPVAEVAKHLGRSQGWVYAEAKKLGCRRRRVRWRQEVPMDQVEHLYWVEGLTLQGVAQRLGLNQNLVWSRMKEAGVARRPTGSPRGGPLRPGEGAELVRLYTEGLAGAEVAKRLGRSQAWVYARAKALGCARAPVRSSVTVEQMNHLYRIEGLSTREVARRLGVSQRTVWSRLKESGKELRPRIKRQVRVERGELERLYVKELLSATEVARRLGVNAYLVGASLDHHGIPRRSRRAPFSDALLRGLYVDEALSVVGVAKRLGTTSGRVHQALVRQGVPLRRASGRLKGRGPITRDELTKLYVKEGLSIAVTAAKLRVVPATVGDALVRHGIARRGSGIGDKLARAGAMREEGRSLRAIAKALGVSRTTLNRHWQDGSSGYGVLGNRVR